MPEATRVDVPSRKLTSETTECTLVIENKLSEQTQHIESGNLSTKSQQMRNGDSNLLLVAGSVVTEGLEPVAEYKAGENSVVHSSEVIRSCQMEKGLSKDFGVLYNVPIKIGSEDSNCIATEYSKPSLEDVKKIQSITITQLESEDVAKLSSLEQFETPSKSLVKKSRLIEHRDKQSAKSIKKKDALRGSDRVLRLKVQDKPKPVESSNSLGAVGNGVEKKKSGRKKGGAKKVVADEFSRIRKRLRYFLNRIHYEQNLIDAYSSEGWKGNSLEKLKPEKELQRAKSEILWRKLKIRDLFQQLDSLCAEGRFPKSLFDSEGQIDSEDIYCAKCGSKDVSAGNDIILCDGACDRGFHQFCLEPPLLSEDIPPDDDGWLCPGCDCKVDCFDLLNDSQGTNLSITDSWEKVFPEAAAAAREGKDQDHYLQLPSDDSDDDDYDPDRPVTIEKFEGSESGSDDSECTSGSDELEAEEEDAHNLGLSSDDSEDDNYDPNAPDVVQSESPSKKHQHEQNLGLSSDDSEDNDYDPDALDVDGSVKQESSSSDFTSDSEDLDALDHELSENHGVNMSSTSAKQNLKGRVSKSSVKDELLGILDSDSGLDGSPPISGKRHVERLDYKKLHDETYGNVPSDSSDDGDWSDSTAPRKRKKTTEQFSSVSPNNGSAKAIKNDHEGNERTPRTTHQKSLVKGTHNSPRKSLEDSPKSGSTSGRAKSSSARRLGEAVIQRLYKSFKENQYPDRATKEALAEELEIRPQQVSKWFENTRWSWRHSSGNEASVSKSISKVSAPLPQAKMKPDERDTRTGNSLSNGLPSASIPMPDKSSGDICDGKAKGVAEESTGQKPTTPTPAKRRGRPKNEKPETTGTRRSGRRRTAA